MNPRDMQRSTAQEAYQQYQLTEAGAFETDEKNPGWMAFNFGQEPSIDLINDPRFFSTTVIEKRLAAFGGLAVVGSMLLSSSVGQMYGLKKDMSFQEIIGCVQFAGFLMHMCVACGMLTSIFVKIQQIFYTYRLLTAGPTGFEQASLFYLNRTMTAWRHLSMKCLMNGMVFYMLATGSVLFVKFIKDATAKNHQIMVDLAKHLGTELTPCFVKFIHEHSADEGRAALKAAFERLPSCENTINEWPLRMEVHYALAGCVVTACAMFASYLHYIKRSHHECFQAHYKYANNCQNVMVNPLRSMHSDRVRSSPEV